MRYLKKYSHEISDFLCVCRRLSDKMYVTSHGGNLSYKLEDDLILISPTCMCKSDISPKDVVLIDLEGTLERCHKYIIAADIWYGTDILGERVPGPALLAEFQPSIDFLSSWKEASNRWIRRSLGVAIHFWAKRTKGQNPMQAQALLEFITPLFEEREMDALKGIGWGLKTIGRYYPEILSPWLHFQVLIDKRQPCALMLRKARTYLPS